jgi:ppGpp synthetase/RelA/SpoT-type nucleotidyltranferase
MRRFARQIASAGHVAVFIKCCDLMHNLAELETTPRNLIKRALERGRTYYLPMLEQVPLGRAFQERVLDTVRQASNALPEPDSQAVRSRLDLAFAQAAAGKTEAHDAVNLLREICDAGTAAVVSFPSHGHPIIVTSGADLPLDRGRWETIRRTVRDDGGVARLKPRMLRSGHGPQHVPNACFAAVDHGFDGSDTLLLWMLPAGWQEQLPESISPETLLRFVLAAVLKPQAELHRDLALEALDLGLDIDLSLANELGIQRGQLRQLVQWMSFCDLAAASVQGEIQGFLHTEKQRAALWHRVRVERRVKKCRSILHKFATSTQAVWPDFGAIEDIAGVRVICPTAWHVQRCVQFFEQSVAERPLAGPIKRYDPEPTPDGYRGVHALRVVRLPSQGAVVKCEVQIRTLLQDAWATLSHTVAYKRDGEAERRKRNALRILSASLAECEKFATAIFEPPEP